jgi:hypothetical protein
MANPELLSVWKTGSTLRHGGAPVYVVSVECVVTGEGCYGTADRIEQRADQRAIIDDIGSQLGREDLTGVSVHSQVQIPPGPTRPRAMLLDQILPGTTKPQASGVHERMHGRAARWWSRHWHCLGSPAQHRMVGHGEIRADLSTLAAGFPKCR